MKNFLYRMPSVMKTVCNGDRRLSKYCICLCCISKFFQYSTDGQVICVCFQCGWVNLNSVVDKISWQSMTNCKAENNGII